MVSIPSSHVQCPRIGRGFSVTSIRLGAMRQGEKDDSPLDAPKCQACSPAKAPCSTLCGKTADRHDVLTLTLVIPTHRLILLDEVLASR